MDISCTDFEDAIERAIAMIPEMFRAQLVNLAIVVEDHPSPDLFSDMGLPQGGTLFGIFTGIPLPERSAVEPPIFPDVILIFRKPIMAACSSLDELEEEIAITVMHEVAHYMGLSEEQLDDLGYG